MLLFRDRLRAVPEERELYQRTKRELAARRWDYVQDYADAKCTTTSATASDATTSRLASDSGIKNLSGNSRAVNRKILRRSASTMPTTFSAFTAAAPLEPQHTRSRTTAPLARQRSDRPLQARCAILVPTPAIRHRCLGLAKSPLHVLYAMLADFPAISTPDWYLEAHAPRRRPESLAQPTALLASGGSSSVSYCSSGVTHRSQVCVLDPPRHANGNENLTV